MTGVSPCWWGGDKDCVGLFLHERGDLGGEFLVASLEVYDGNRVLIAGQCGKSVGKIASEADAKVVCELPRMPILVYPWSKAYCAMTWP